MNALGASPPGVVPFGIATAIPVVVATVISCAHPSTEPHEMSLQGHEEAARQASQESERLRENPCPPTTGEAVQTNAVCWTPSLASEAQRARAAEQQQRLAEAHGKAAAELREEADSACAGVAEADRVTIPFFHVQDLDGARPLRAPHDSKRPGQPKIGVTIFVRPVLGLTEQRLQRLVNCHLAQNALVGHVSAVEPDCPLVPAGVSAAVRSASDRFAVDIKGSSPEVVKEIETRTRLLVGNRWID